VIDSNDKERLPLARAELLELSEKLDGGPSSIPIFIVANKQDLSSSFN
jgi:signal recognition particle receptor subunit beta